MATAALRDSAPAPLPWAVTMHVSRPKSAKGQRPSLSRRQGTEAWPCHVPPSPRDLASSLRAPLTKPQAFPPARVSPEKIPKLLQQVPSKSCSSLNKYRVLPSIVPKGGGSGAAGQTDRPGASWGQEDAPKTVQTFSGERGSASALPGSGVPPEESSQVRRAPEQGERQESPGEPRVLLAVRSPSGRRFEHRFKPSDSLQTVLAVAGQKLLANYRHCSVETTEVPRRNFPDLSKSLRECGIPPRSVLCIRQQRGAEDL
ncbi:UBX10 protein, partial [Regulus satrapa]|nr:UBX10 protein [Regulus satrapa]